MTVYIGIDWSSKKHDIVYLNEEGGMIAYQTIPHTPFGFEAFDDKRMKLGVGVEDCLVGIENRAQSVHGFPELAPLSSDLCHSPDDHQRFAAGLGPAKPTRIAVTPI